MFPVFILIGRRSAQQGLGTSRLPTFSVQEKSYIKGTSDFLGIGHFTTRYVTQKSFPFLQVSSYCTDQDLAELVDPKWPAPGSKWLYSVPWGFRRLLNFIKVITEYIFKKNKESSFKQEFHFYCKDRFSTASPIYSST